MSHWSRNTYLLKLITGLRFCKRVWGSATCSGSVDLLQSFHDTTSLRFRTPFEVAQTRLRFHKPFWGYANQFEVSQAWQWWKPLLTPMRQKRLPSLAKFAEPQTGRRYNKQTCFDKHKHSSFETKMPLAATARRSQQKLSQTTHWKYIPTHI